MRVNRTTQSAFTDILSINKVGSGLATNKRILLTTDRTPKKNTPRLDRGSKRIQMTGERRCDGSFAPNERRLFPSHLHASRRSDARRIVLPPVRGECGSLTPRSWQPRFPGSAVRPSASARLVGFSLLAADFKTARLRGGGFDGVFRRLIQNPHRVVRHSHRQSARAGRDDRTPVSVWPVWAKGNGRREAADRPKPVYSVGRSHVGRNPLR